MRYYEDPILGKGRAADVSGGTGSADYVGGTRIVIGGETISFVNSATIQNVTGNSVTLEPDTAYKITATASAVTLNANVPAAGSWAYEGHAEIFVAGTGYVQTGANVVLANALEPDAVNNCTVRFHDGLAIISVEDHVAGYIVVSATGSTAGSLPYGLTSATQEYIAFDATTNGAVIDLAGATASGEKHLVGNGYTSTTLTGAVDCGTSKFTVANLALSDVGITGGTLTLGDAFIPSGSTVAVSSGGGLAVESVSGNGGVIDLGGTNLVLSSGASMTASGVVITSGSAGYGGGFYVNKGSVTLSGCTIASCLATGDGGAMRTLSGTAVLADCQIVSNAASRYTGGIVLVSTTATLTRCTFSANTGSFADDLYVSTGAVAELTDCALRQVRINGGTLTLTETNRIGSVTGTNNLVNITSSAVLDFSNASDAAAISATQIAVAGKDPTKSITVLPYGGGASTTIVGGTYTQINNDGTTVPAQP